MARLLIVSFAYWLFTSDWVTDPGTYVYTPLPDRRNACRSMAAHFAPQARDGREPNPIGSCLFGLFAQRDRARTCCLFFGATAFLGTHAGFGVPVYRWVQLTTRDILVTDCAPEDPELAGGGTESVVSVVSRPPTGVSPGYGMLLR